MKKSLLFFTVFFVFSFQNNAQTIKEDTITLKFNSQSLIENNLMFFDITTKQAYSAADACDTIGDIGFFYQTSYGNILLSPDAYYIRELYSYNGIVYDITNKKQTKFEKFTGNWADITIDNFQETISISEFINGNQDNGNGVNELLAGDIVKFETQDSIIGFAQIFPEDNKIQRSAFLKIKLLDTTASYINNSVDKLKIYPTLTTGIINVEAQNNIQQIAILDITGKTVLQVAGNNTYRQTILLSCRPGIYFVEIQTDKQMFTAKIVKE